MTAPAKILSLLLCMLLAAAEAGAQTQLEIITLNNRTVAEMLPILEPLVEGQGAIAGIDNKLILRATPAAIAAVKEVLSKIDTVPRNLIITVNQEIVNTGENQSLSAKGRIGIGKPNPSVNVEARGQSQSSKNDKQESQRVLTLEGRPAFIQIRQSIPFVERTFPGNVIQDKTVFKDISTGFHVIPHIRGEAVVLQIAPQSSSIEKNAFDIQEISTTITTRIGEWVEIGGLLQTRTSAQSGIAASSAASSQDTRSVSIKVEIHP